ncbi:ATP-binding protein [Chitinivorax sp. B]|uniref:ATP-binding protein n=1 Tax=Chitinivorax sp. B TaxID=2502235 RepID=UPI0024B571FD|nr:ATP-binding protein [Chitinivorax sp. B]
MISVLLIEDDENDALLVRHELSRHYPGISLAWVSRPDALEAALERRWDVVVSDYSMPGFAVGQSLDMVHQAWPDMPFIVLTGAIGEEAAVALLKSGASNFLLKQNLYRLAAVIEHEMGQSAQRRLQAAAEQALRQANEALELRVAERTEDLLVRNQELEASKHQLEEAQSQLLQSEKLASIGQLAAGVAHEINNPIGYVYSNLSALSGYLDEIFKLLTAYVEAEPELPTQRRMLLEGQRRQADLDFLRDDVRALFAECTEGLGRIKKIVADLKDFSRTGADDEWQYADLRRCLDSTLNIVRNELKYKAEIVQDYHAIPEIECLPSQLNQVFLNMLVNASHAIADQGVITLRTEQEDDWIWVEIADTGAGIAEENLKRIFDPFFTTKPVGTGTGLGLSLSYGIVQKHGGRIEVTSQLGVGTAFRIWLPIRQTAKDEELQS